MAGEEIMSSQNVSSTLIVTWVVGTSLAMFLGAGAARAQTSSANYIFLVASGFLCNLGDSSACLGVVKSAQGDSFEISGAGTLNTPTRGKE
jgi:hypothetical protein